MKPLREPGMYPGDIVKYDEDMRSYVRCNDSSEWEYLVYVGNGMIFDYRNQPVFNIEL